MKILHLASNRNRTGSAASALMLASSLQATGHDVHFAHKGSNLAGFVDQVAFAGSHVLKFDSNGRPWNIIADVRRLRGIVAEFGIEVIHCHQSVDHLVARMAMGRRPRTVPIVRTYHEPRGAAPGVLARTLFGRAADQLVTVTRAMAQQLRERIGSLDGRITSVPGAVDTAVFTPSDAAAGRRVVEIPDGRRILGMNSKLSPDRGVDRLVALFARLMTDGKIGDAHLLLVGSESPAPYYRMADELGVGGRLTAINEIDDLIPTRLSAMDVAVQLVPGRDGSARAAIELMALGKPVIAERRGALAELVEPAWGRNVDGDAELEAAIVELMNDAELAASLGEAARSRAEKHHSIDSWVRAYVDIYEKALGSAS